MQLNRCGEVNKSRLRLPAKYQVNREMNWCDGLRSRRFDAPLACCDDRPGAPKAFGRAESHDFVRKKEAKGESEGSLISVFRQELPQTQTRGLIHRVHLALPSSTATTPTITPDPQRSPPPRPTSCCQSRPSRCEKSPAGNANRSHHVHYFDERVNRRAACVLQRAAHRIAGYRSPCASRCPYRCSAPCRAARLRSSSSRCPTSRRRST